jgi:hypothetical protein
MRVLATRVFGSAIAILGVFCMVSMWAGEMKAAPHGGGHPGMGGGFGHPGMGGGFSHPMGGGFSHPAMGGSFRPMMPMRTPATGFAPSGVNPGMMSQGIVTSPSQVGNRAITANSANTMFLGRMEANTGFSGFGINGFGRLSTFSSGLGAFNLGVRTGVFSSMGGFGMGVGGFGVSGFSGFNGSNGPFLNGFNNLNGFNSFAPIGGGSKLGFNGSNGL